MKHVRKRLKICFLTITLSLTPSSCSWLEDTVNERDSKTPVNVTAASVCTDNYVSISERIILDVPTDTLGDLMHMASSGFVDTTLSQVIQVQASQAHQISQRIAAKEEFLKGKMRKPFYRDILTELYLHGGQHSPTYSCYQVLFTYHYSKFDLGSPDNRVFKTLLRLNQVDPSTGEQKPCAMDLMPPLPFQEIQLCLDDRPPEYDDDGDSGDFDDD